MARLGRNRVVASCSEFTKWRVRLYLLEAAPTWIVPIGFWHLSINVATSRHVPCKHENGKGKGDDGAESLFIKEAKGRLCCLRSLCVSAFNYTRFFAYPTFPYIRSRSLPASITTTCFQVIELPNRQHEVRRCCSGFCRCRCFRPVPLRPSPVRYPLHR